MKRILILAVYYPPSQAIGAKRPYKIAEFLSEANWDVTVLTVNPALTPPINLTELENEGIRTIRTRAFVPYVSIRNRFSRYQTQRVIKSTNTVSADTKNGIIFNKLISASRHVVGKFFTSLNKIDMWGGWQWPALAEMKKRGMRFDVVLSTAPPHSTAYLAMRLAAAHGGKLVLDYRDPWVEVMQSSSSSRKRKDRKILRQIRFENECLAAADLVLTVSPAISAMLAKRVDKKILTVPQGFSGEIARVRFERDNMYVLYAGSLEYGRDISQILSAIRRVDELYNERLRLVYCGPDSKTANHQAISVGATQYVDIKDQVKECEVNDYARRALCNIVIVSKGYEYSYPGKVFDLIPAGRPIYVLSSLESEAGKLIDKYEMGYSFTDANISSMTQKLKEEISRDFCMPSQVNDLRVDKIYKMMVEEGLNTL